MNMVFPRIPFKQRKSASDKDCSPLAGTSSRKLDPQDEMEGGSASRFSSNTNKSSSQKSPYNECWPESRNPHSGGANNSLDRSRRAGSNGSLGFMLSQVEEETRGGGNSCILLEEERQRRPSQNQPRKTKHNPEDEIRNLIQLNQQALQNSSPEVENNLLSATVAIHKNDSDLSSITQTCCSTAASIFPKAHRRQILQEIQNQNKFEKTSDSYHPDDPVVKHFNNSYQPELFAHSPARNSTIHERTNETYNYSNGSSSSRPQRSDRREATSNHSSSSNSRATQHSTAPKKRNDSESRSISTSASKKCRSPSPNVGKSVGSISRNSSSKKSKRNDLSVSASEGSLPKQTWSPKASPKTPQSVATKQSTSTKQTTFGKLSKLVGGYYNSHSYKDDNDTRGTLSTKRTIQTRKSAKKKKLPETPTTASMTLFSDPSYAKTEQSGQHDWAMIAVITASSVLSAGGDQDAAEAAIAAVLGSEDKSDLAVAAEASTAVLATGSHQDCAAAAAVAVLKACDSSIASSDKMIDDYLSQSQASPSKSLSSRQPQLVRSLSSKTFFSKNNDETVSIDKETIVNHTVGSVTLSKADSSLSLSSKESSNGYKHPHNATSVVTNMKQSLNPTPSLSSSTSFKDYDLFSVKSKDIIQHASELSQYVSSFMTAQPKKTSGDSDEQTIQSEFNLGRHLLRVDETNDEVELSILASQTKDMFNRARDEERAHPYSSSSDQQEVIRKARRHLAELVHNGSR